MMVSSSLVHALGMGEIEVNTSLNQPLDAKIKLFSATPDELNSLKVEMASKDVFSRIGIDRLPILLDLEFELVSTGAGAPYIKVSSSKAVKEPFLDFLLTINWANGQMMREYTLLLDPPVFEKDQQVGRISAATTQPAQVVREEPAAPARAVQPRVAPPGSYGPTSRKDTLWTVAQGMRPDRSVSVPQMMIGLLKKNPEAFDNNNINNLKAGYVLRQPEMEVITELSKSDAAAESNRQYQDWLASKGKGPAVSGRQQRVASAAPAAATESVSKPAVAPAVTPKSQTEARLQLLSPDEEARIRSGVGSGTSGEATESLRRELAIAQESAEASRQENADLRSRLDDLEMQLQSVQKLLTLKDDTFGALQADAQREAQAEATTPVTEEQAEQPVVAAAKEPAKPAVQPEPVQTSLLDEILANPMYMAAGGGVLVLLLLVAMKMRRSRQVDEEDFTVMTPVVQPTETKEGADVKSGAGAVAETAISSDDSAAEAESDEDVSIGDFGSGMEAIQAEESEIDPVAEADVYLAYRRYEQAEALLKEAIGADPERHELKLKLLEIYQATKDTESFEAQAESLYAALGGQEEQLWSQAVQMGRELLPDHPLFSEGVVSESGDIAAEEAGLDFESDEADSEISEEFSLDEDQSVSEESPELSDDALAESLNLSGMEAESETAGIEEAAGLGGQTDELDVSLDDLGDLDLDLDLGSDDLTDITSEDETKADNAVEDLADSLEGNNELDLGAELDTFSTDESAEEEVLTDLGDVQEEALESLEETTDTVVGFEGTETVAEKELSLSEGDEHLDTSESESADVDLDSFSTGESESWDVEPAQSTYHSKDVESETDGLLDTARNEESDLDNLIDLDVDSLSSGETEESADLTADLNVKEEPVSAATDEENIDPLADITNLGEMDFSELSDEDNDDIFDSSDDMVGTKLDLAKAYIDMGDQDGARSILDEVVEEGDDDQRQEAEQLKQQIS